MNQITPVLEVDYREFEKEVEKVGLLPTYKKLEALWYEVRKQVPYMWDNKHIRITNIFGEPFTIAVYKLCKITGEVGVILTIWDAAGHHAVLRMRFDGEGKPNRQEWNAIVDKINKFTKGIIHCSHCDTPIDIHKDIYHTFFAGIYCPTCWIESGVAAEEARETYD